MAVEAEVGEDGAVDVKKGKKKFLIMAAGGLLAVLLIGGALFVFLGIGKAPVAKPAADAAVVAPQSFIFNLPSMTVNLNTQGKAEAFMKLSVALEVANQAMMTEIQPRMAKIVDAFQVYLRELRPSDLEGSAGIYRLKEELLRRVNVAIAPAHVDAILFKEILVQ